MHLYTHKMICASTFITTSLFNSLQLETTQIPNKSRRDIMEEWNRVVEWDHVLLW